MSEKKENILIEELFKPLQCYEEKDDYLTLLKKIISFRETLDEKQGEDFRELFFLIKEYMSCSKINRYNKGFEDGMLRAEIKQKRQNKTD